MTTFFATLLVFALLMTAMALGVMLQGKALKGSCGGTGNGCPCTEKERKVCAAKRREAA